MTTRQVKIMNTVGQYRAKQIWDGQEIHVGEIDAISVAEEAPGPVFEVDGDEIPAMEFNILQGLGNKPELGDKWLSRIVGEAYKASGAPDYEPGTDEWLKCVAMTLDLLPDGEGELTRNYAAWQTAREASERVAEGAYIAADETFMLDRETPENVSESRETDTDDEAEVTTENSAADW